MDREKVIIGLECCQLAFECKPYERCPYSNGYECGDCDINQLHYDALILLKEQEEEIENLKQTAVKPTIDEYGKAYCVCGENVGIIPNNKNLPSVFAKYCPECGRRMKWE